MNEAKKNISPEQFGFVLKYLNHFMPLTETELSGLLQYCELRHFEKKAVILREGEMENYLNMVLQGLVRKYIRVKKNEVTLQLATEGHVIHAEISFLSRIPSLVTIETLEPATLLSISYQKMEEALENYPKGERLGRLILTGMYVKKDEKWYDRLSKTTRERFFDYIDQHPHMLQRVSQKYLASYLNIKPETFSRLKKLVPKRKK